jgi:hypothetical protein
LYQLCPGWSQTEILLPSPPEYLGSQYCTTMPGLVFEKGFTLTFSSCLCLPSSHYFFKYSSFFLFLLSSGTSLRTCQYA